MVDAEEAAKATLVRDLNALIFQSSVQQMEALEDLQTRMDKLTAKAGASVEAAGAAQQPTPPAAAASAAGQDSAASKPDAVQLARAELEAVALIQQAEAAAARSRHVPLRPKAKPMPSTESEARPSAPSAAPARDGGGGFAGFAD